MAENLNTSFQQGMDAGVVMDNLATRLRNIETHLLSEDDLFEAGTGLNAGLDSSFQQAASHPQPAPASRLGSPIRGSVQNFSKKMSSTKIRRLEEYIYELRGQVQELDTDVQQVKSTVVSRFKDQQWVGGSPARGGSTGGGFGYAAGQGGAGISTAPLDAKVASRVERNKEEIRSLHKKLKKLAENTTRACRSLSGGLSDVQQATLNLYSWSDVAHDAFGTVSHQIGLASNILSQSTGIQPSQDFSLRKLPVLLILISIYFEVVVHTCCLSDILFYLGAQANPKP